jgi:hypothetical protein
MMRPRLDESDPRVRAAAIACLANHGDVEHVLLASRALEDMLGMADPDHRAEAVRAIGAIHGDALHGKLLRVLEDGSPRVAREAVIAVERIVARDGFNPLFAPRLISMLRDRKVKLQAREALVAFGQPAVGILIHFMNDPGESVFVRRALPKALARIGGRQAVRALVDALGDTKDGFLRAQLVEALALHRKELEEPDLAEKIDRAVEAEARRWLRRLSEVVAVSGDRPLQFEGPLLRWDPRELDLLTQMVAERMEEHLRTLFGLLALRLPARDVWASYRSLLTGQVRLRAHALEYLDNRLSGELRRNVFAVIDDTSVEEKLQNATRWFGIRRPTREEAVRDFLGADPEGNADAQALVVAGLYTVYTEGMTSLRPCIEHCRVESADPLVRETADWVARRLAATGA